MFDTVIVRYGEIFLKSEFVKRRFENLLAKNIRSALEKNAIEAKVTRKRHRIYVDSEDTEKTAKIVTDVFGVVSSSPAIRIEPTMEAILGVGGRFAKNTIKNGETFAVRAQRSRKSGFTSRDVEIKLGSRILELVDTKVDLENPKKTIFVEIHKDRAFVFDRKLEGVGGLPYGSQGKAIAVMSDELSAIAAWMIMRRGCEIVALADSRRATELIRALERFTPSDIKVYGGQGNVAEIAAKEKVHAILSSEVSDSKTAEKALESVEQGPANMPFFYPLLGLDDGQIKGIGEKLGLSGRFIKPQL